MYKYINIESERFDGMISIDDKNYILFKGDKLIRHGSGLKGKHLPAICDFARDDLCWAIFKGKPADDVLRKYADLRSYPLKVFTMHISLSKKPQEYHKTTLYAKLVKALALKGIRVVWGAGLEYVKTVNGYEPVFLVSEDAKIDYKYYQKRVAEVASRILGRPAKELYQIIGGQRRLG